jgi:SAM-dependent MidA family methyltransferase
MKEEIKFFIESRAENRQVGVSFFEYMNFVLYAPAIGYYSSSMPKIGSHGDFTTSPELTPLFAKAIALQFEEIFSRLKDVQEEGYKNILEFGAGSGKFAIDILLALEALGVEVEHYFILELSEGLRVQQQEYCSKFEKVFKKISWLDALPKEGSFSGIIFANEVLDAMPVHRFIKKNGEILEQSVRLKADPKVEPEIELEYGDPLKPSENLLRAVSLLEEKLEPFSEGFCSEINLFIEPWLKSVYQTLKQGAVLLIDYGYPEAEYYSPSRASGTLSCYSKHRVNNHPLLNPCHQDITAHVDFTQVVTSAMTIGFELEGYTTQGLFLANLINFNLSSNHSKAFGFDQVDPMSSQHLRRLMHPGAMGEVFKVVGLSKNISRDSEEDLAWLGFKGVDQRHRL